MKTRLASSTVISLFAALETELIVIVFACHKEDSIVVQCTSVVFATSHCLDPETSSLGTRKPWDSTGLADAELLR